MRGRQPNATAAFTPGEIPGTHFQRLSRPQGTWFRRSPSNLFIDLQTKFSLGSKKQKECPVQFSPVHPCNIPIVTTSSGLGHRKIGPMSLKTRWYSNQTGNIHTKQHWETFAYHWCSAKAISITYYECVSVALVFQHAKRMRRVIFPHGALPAVPYLSTLFHKQHDFQNNVIEHKLCVLVFSTTFVWNISHSKKNSMSYYHKCTNVFMYSTYYSCHILMKF